ncbi:MAG: c-type cytochrome, partial [Pseudomonadota bacterium]
GNFLVFDSKNGDVLLKQDIGGAMAGGVVTYELDSKQYVAVASGNISRNAFGDVGLPSVVIMTLNPDQPAQSLDATTATASGIANGRRLYSQVCASCHGTDGNFIADHKLGTLAARMDINAAMDIIRNPKAPMPKLFPDLIDEQSVADVARFL